MLFYFIIQQGGECRGQATCCLGLGCIYNAVDCCVKERGCAALGLVNLRLIGRFQDSIDLIIKVREQFLKLKMYSLLLFLSGETCLIPLYHGTIPFGPLHHSGANRGSMGAW